MMPCPQCRPLFVEFKKKWSLKAFRELRTKYTDQHIQLGWAMQRIQELEEELDTMKGK